VNIHCPAQKLRALIHFAGKSGLDIEGFGAKALEQLFERGLVKDIPDLYELSAAALAEMPGWGEKSAANAMAALAQSKNPTLARFITALGIRYVGEVSAQLLENRFGTLEQLHHASQAELEDSEGIGPQVAASLVAFFSNDNNRQILARLAQAGLKFQERPAVAANLPLAGKVFLFTGGLAGLSRSEAKNRVKGLGGQVASAISRKVTHVVAGEKAGGKLAQANDLGLVIISEEEFKSMLEI
jgi:DNA ligase (NAD+)